MNLDKYCSADTHRVNISKPFSRGEWTYATDGHILVRIPRDQNVPEIKDAPEVERIVPSNIYLLTFRELHLPVLPPYEEKKQACEDCDGRGSEHDCPDCNCQCENCDGSGEEMVNPRLYVAIDGIPYDLKYLHWLRELPNITVADPATKESPCPFRFDGGEGLIMPVRWDGPYVAEVKTK